MRLAHKVVLALAAAIVLVQSISAALQVQREHELFLRDIARDELVLASVLGPTVERIWRASGEEEAMAVVEQAARREESVRIGWVWLDDDQLLEVRREGDALVTAPEERDGAIVTHAVVRAPDGRRGAVRIADPLADEEAYMERSVMAASTTALVMVGLSVLLAWMLGLTLVGRPIRRLVGQARRVGGGDLSQRLEVRSRDELGALAGEMNRMCDALAAARAQEHKQAMEKVAALEQLRHADRLTTVGTLASGIAHELGTPLNVIDGHAQLIREDSDATPAIEEKAEIIGDQTRRMTSIVHQLMTFARRDGGVRVMVDVGAVASDVLQMVQPLARRRQVETRLEKEGEDTRASVKPGQLEQVLTNVVVNGLHATSGGGRVIVRVGRERAVRPATREENRYVRVMVEDTGVGMDEQTRQRIFEPFFTTKDVGDGTGLGLSVAYGIVEDHGGWIDVESELGQGSRFSVYLPVEGSS